MLRRYEGNGFGRDEALVSMTVGWMFGHVEDLVVRTISSDATTIEIDDVKLAQRAIEEILPVFRRAWGETRREHHNGSEDNAAQEDRRTDAPLALEGERLAEPDTPSDGSGAGPDSPHLDG